MNDSEATSASRWSASVSLIDPRRRLGSSNRRGYPGRKPCSATQFYDPIAINYGALQPDATFLIGPDGKLIARGLQGTALEKAVAEALAGK